MPNREIIKNTNIDIAEVACSNCQACCCHLEVILLSDTGVPQRYIQTDAQGSEVMERLDDGWCAALDRNTLLCSIYENRPWVCREFAEASQECLAERELMRKNLN